MKILVNTIITKRSSGGAFQISYNFLLKTLEHSEIDWYYFTSADLDYAIGDKFTNIKDIKYFVFPTQPDFQNSYFRVKKEIKILEEKICPDVIYSITAPCYFKFNTIEVMRFTNPLVTHPNKYSQSMLPLIKRIKNWLYCQNQKRMMKSCKFFITQTETTKKGIVRITGVPENNVCVVNNVLPSVFKSIDSTLIQEDEWINIACVGNPVPHKNFDIVPDVLKELRSLGLSNIRFHMTIPFGHPMETLINKKLKQYEMIDCVVNHGRISQFELGKMYRRCQFAFLPTLLEVFSASTIEAMYFDLPIVATSFDFNKEVLADSCLYYEPKNAKDAAVKLSRLILDKQLQCVAKSKMKFQLEKYGDYDSHFNRIVDFLIKVTKQN